MFGTEIDISMHLFGVLLKVSDVIRWEAEHFYINVAFPYADLPEKDKNIIRLPNLYVLKSRQNIMYGWMGICIVYCRQPISGKLHLYEEGSE